MVLSETIVKFGSAYVARNAAEALYGAVSVDQSTASLASDCGTNQWVLACSAGAYGPGAL